MKAETDIEQCLEYSMAFIERHRRRLGISQKELARRMGVCQATVSKRLSGELTCSPGALQGMADALGLQSRVTVEVWVPAVAR